MNNLRDEEKTKLPVFNSCIHNLKDIVININGKFENAESLIPKGFDFLPQKTQLPEWSR